MAIIPTYSRTSTQVPTPIAPSNQIYVSNAGNPGNATKYSNLEQGDTGALITKFNKNATRAELADTYGGGGYAVLWGLDIEESTGLNLLVNPGAAMINGLTQVSSAMTLTLPSTGQCYIWLQDNGTLTYQNGSLSAPSAACVYLGYATTNSSAIVSLDFAGILYNKSNHLWRRTGDTQAPADSPPDGVQIVTKTLGGIYEWDGAQHKQRVDPDQMVFTSSGPKFIGGHLYQHYAVTSGSGTITLGVDSANIQRVLPTAHLHVLLPASGSINPGMQFSVYNDAAATYNVLLYDATNTTLISTIGPKEVVVVNPVVGGTSTFYWPSSLTPVGSS